MQFVDKTSYSGKHFSGILVIFLGIALILYSVESTKSTINLDKVEKLMLLCIE